MKITENIETSVKYECDVTVVGGGVGGIAAALAAARSGSSVMLVESGYMLGGLATAGLVTIYLPLCDGLGTQVSYGIAEELLRLSIKHGTEENVKYSEPYCWLGEGSIEQRKERRYEVQFNPWFFALDAERLLISEGVKIIYGASVVSTLRDGKNITHLVIEGKSGREAISTRAVVDASGDAVVAYLAGAECAEYAPKNMLAAWYYYNDGKNNKLNMLGVCDDPDGEVKPLVNKRYRALGTDEISEMMIDSHASTYNDIIRKRASGERVFPTAISAIPQVRMTRRIVGKSTSNTSDERKYIDGSIGAFSNWRKRGPAYELSFGTICTNDIDNLFAAGRCISATDDMWDLTRVIPVCAVSGEAAGVAASMVCNGTLEIGLLQRTLCERGVKIHL